MSEIRIISLWEPWASFIAHGLKRYETRSWKTPYRGRLAIHAAKRKVKQDEILPILCAVGDSVDRATLDKLEEITKSDLPYGAIIAVADLADCQEMYQNPIVTDSNSRYINICDQTALERAVGDWKPGRFAWKLENVRPIQPIYATGKQGLSVIRYPTLLDAIEQQLAQTAEIERQLAAIGGGKP